MILDDSKRIDMFNNANNLEKYFKNLYELEIIGEECYFDNIFSAIDNLKAMVQNPFNLSNNQIDWWNSHYNKLTSIKNGITKVVECYINDRL